MAEEVEITRAPWVVLPVQCPLDTGTCWDSVFLNTAEKPKQQHLKHNFAAEG